MKIMENKRQNGVAIKSDSLPKELPHKLEKNVSVDCMVVYNLVRNF